MERDDEYQEREERLANKRRQAYWRNRRRVQRMVDAGPALALDRMSSTMLWLMFERDFGELLSALSDGSSPTMYALARNAWDCYAEVLQRGEQLKFGETID